MQVLLSPAFLGSRGLACHLVKIVFRQALAEHGIAANEVFGLSDHVAVLVVWLSKASDIQVATRSDAKAR